MPISKERLAEISAMPDDQIDTSGIPELDDTFFETARLVRPDGTTKKTVAMRPLNNPTPGDFRAGSLVAVGSDRESGRRAPGCDRREPAAPEARRRGTGR